MPPQSRALFNLLNTRQLDISPCFYLILLLSPWLTPPGFSLFFFLLRPLLLSDFHVFLCGALQVSSQNFSRSRKRETLGLCQRGFSSWRRSSRGNSRMMTGIVKGQISPCGFASDCMFISFWSGRDSKPLSRSPHSPNSWSSACHWNRLRADPGDRGKVAVCHPTSVLAREISSAVFYFCFKMSMADHVFMVSCTVRTHELHCCLFAVKVESTIVLVFMNYTSVTFGLLSFEIISSSSYLLAKKRRFCAS